MRSKKGFTLIELVVVIAVLGILAAIGIPRMVESFKISRGHRMIADLRLLDSAIAFYTAQHGEPPESLAVLAEEPQIIAAVPEKLGADFIVKQNSGTEKEYTGAESWNYGINPETNRAYYGGSGQENQNIEFYLFGESSGGSGGTGGGLATKISGLDNLIKDFRKSDSWSINDNDNPFKTSDNPFFKQLREMEGISAANLSRGGGGANLAFLTISTVDYTGKSNQCLVPTLCIQYDPATDSYAYRAIVGEVTWVSDGNINPGHQGQYGTESNEGHPYTTLENALARYENLVKGYEAGYLTHTGQTPNYEVTDEGVVTPK